jgi:ribosomal protein S18 acetylase RimI-like enzyme
MRDGIKPLDPQDRSDVADAARLYAALLPNTALTKLGEDFMKGFYFGALVEDGIIRCDLYYYQGRPAGFIAYTEQGWGFVSVSVRRHWFRLGMLLGWSVLRNPARLKTIGEVLLLMRKRGDEPPPPYRAEFLVFGVLPEFRSREFIQQTGRRISAELFENAKQCFARLGLPGFRLMVEADNREAVLFYHRMGCKLEKLSFGEGKVLQAVFALSRETTGGRAGRENPA